MFGLPEVASSLSPSWFAGRNDVWIFREVAGDAGVPTEEYGRRYAELEAAYLERLRRNMRVWRDRKVLPGVRELLERLSSDGGADGAPRDLGLVTGNLEEGARIKLGAFGLDHFFPSGGFGTDALERSEIARIARRRFEERRGVPIAPGKVALIGDTIHDILAARSCGYRAVAVATGTTTLPILAEASPDLLLENLSDPTPLLDLLSSE